MGDIPINADVGPYPGEEEAAEDVADNSVNGQMEDLDTDVSLKLSTQLRMMRNS